MNEQPIAVGIAGLGRAGWDLHVSVLKNMSEQFRITAVCDSLPQRLREAESLLGCRTYTDYSGFLTDPDLELVVIATPSQLHETMALQAMESGKHVLVEKPFATDTISADRMIETAVKKKVVLTGSHNLRYQSDFLKVREVVGTGQLGRIIQIRIAWHWFRRRWDWQTLAEYGGGTLNNNGSHVIDQALLLLGSAEPEVFCQMGHTPLSLGDAEDYVKIILSTPNGPLIDIELSNATAYPQEQWHIMGSRGGLIGGNGKLRWKYIDPEQLPQRAVKREPTPDRSYNQEQFSWTEETCDFSNEPFNLINARLYGELFQTLREDKPLAVTPQSIRRQLRVIEKCRERGIFFRYS